MRLFLQNCQNVFKTPSGFAAMFTAACAVSVALHDHCKEKKQFNMWRENELKRRGLDSDEKLCDALGREQHADPPTKPGV